MLKLTAKEFEIEEEVVLDNDKGEVLYKFMMQITPEEKNKIEGFLMSKADIEFARKIKKVEELSDEYFEIIENYHAEKLKQQGEFEDIVFKEHKEKFYQIAGEARYTQMAEKITDFFWKAFIKKNEEQKNTMNSDLKRISKN